jgi:hypothetical protein
VLGIVVATNLMPELEMVKKGLGVSKNSHFRESRFVASILHQSVAALHTSPSAS